MPGFSMNGREIWQIVAFIRGLTAGKGAGGAATGDPKAGKAALEANGCLNCHSINGLGSTRGVDLTAAGARLHPPELREAITDPNAEVAPEHWIWTAVANDGQKLRGSRLNEDTFSLQILDNTGKLRSIAKADLKEQTLEKRSPMPSFKTKLSPAQIDDIVAYLSTLTGGVR